MNTIECKYTGKTIELPKEVTPEQYNSWVNKWGKRVKIIDIPVDDEKSEVITVVALVPNRRTVGQVEKWIESDPDKAKSILVNDCVIANKDKINNSTDYAWFTCAGALMSLLPIGQAEVKN